MEFHVGRMKVVLLKGDITEVEADAIVNAANSFLEHGGGVAGALVRKGGKEIQEESRELVRKFGPVPVGDVVVTRAGKLKAKYIIHAVGPRYGVEGTDLLRSAIRRSIEKARELGVRKLVMPAISTGIYGYPYEVCAEVMADVLSEMKEVEMNLIVCLYSDEAYEKFQNVFSKKFLKS